MKTYRAITGTLIARTSVHTGSGEGADLTDALCRRDAAGHFTIPGTALGGALRTLTTRLAPRLKLGGGAKVCKALNETSPNDEETCGCPVCHLFGEINPREDNSE